MAQHIKYVSGISSNPSNRETLTIIFSNGQKLEVLAFPEFHAEGGVGIMVKLVDKDGVSKKASFGN